MRIPRGVLLLLMLPLLAIGGFIVAKALIGGPEVAVADETDTEDMDYLRIPLETITGDTTSLAAYDGRVRLLVNTASKCGFTPQYEGLQALYETYGDRGFTVIGFPANDFMNQEPGSDEEIQQFCTTEYSVTFPMMSKISVKGKDKHPLYAYLTEESPVPGEITWNFNKFLLDEKGNVVARFGSKVEPRDERITRRIERLLAEEE